MVDSDVFARKITETGEVYAGPTRVKKLVVTSSEGGGVVLRDGGAAGSVRLEQDVPGGAIVDIGIPDGGLRFRHDVHATLTGMTSVTFYMA